jgi:hypothetical protein
MRLKLLAFVVIAGLSLPELAVARDRACCDSHKDTCPMPCCKHDKAPDPVDVLLTFGGHVTTPDEVFAPSVQRAVVWFHRPVWVGRNVLMGQYIIEHDTGRQARGEPCTHIYAVDNPRSPVVTFHCTHLTAEKSDRAQVVLQSMGDGVHRLVQFQFAGEDAAHGMPVR